MIRWWAATALVLVFRGTAMTEESKQDHPGREQFAHVRTEFRFSVNLPYEFAAPLFGPLGERKWAPEWKPQFVYPNPPADEEAAVFRVDYPPSHSSVWTTTVFDLAHGHVQYVLILNSVIVTRIDIRLAKDGAQKTDVSVIYERTALDRSANEHVTHLASKDAHLGEQWKEAINAYGATLSAANAKQKTE